MKPDILLALMRLGPSRASDLIRDLNVSQPTVSRMLSASQSNVIRAGGSKNTIYAAARQIRQVKDSRIPVFQINEDGEGRLIGTIASVYPEGFLWLGARCPWPLDNQSKQYFQSLPYFIHDLRPQGFMGRHFAHLNAEVLGVPDNPERWTEDDITVALSMMGDDLAGNLIIGEAAYRRFQQKTPSIIEEETLPDLYFELAQRSVSSGITGSSAAGEFPKFTALRRRNGVIHHVIVKFSGSGESPAERRWADLLRCEAHAAKVVSEHLGVHAAKAMAFSHRGRTFMESERFDRIGLDGRLAQCSLGALDSELLGLGDPAWDKFAEKLLTLRLIDRSSATAMRRVWFFGKLIANTDMHAGNLSFRLTSSRKLAVCPIYDMLPMRYAPLRGGEVPEIPAVSIDKPLPGDEEDFGLATNAALLFWRRVATDPDISDAFKSVAETWCQTLQRLCIGIRPR